jgi:hypothetical protein
MGQDTPMRLRLFVFVLLLAVGMLQAFRVPYSHELVKTTDNCLTGLQRADPPDQAIEPLGTEARVWHDGHNLCIQFEMTIDSTFVPGVNATWDDYQNSDYIRVQLSTIEDSQFAYFFAVYPLGNCVDAIRDENLNLDNAWNSSFVGESHYEGNSWTCLVKIPFRALRFSGKPPYHWGISIARRNESLRSSYVYPYSSTSQMTREAYFRCFIPIEIGETIETPRNYRIVPSFYRSYDLVGKTQSFDPDNVGLTLVYRPSTLSSVKMAFNPDFSDVPVDEERDSHNDRYPPTLNENRLFFTEDVNAFGVGSSEFYSRNIMQPKYAVKYTLNTPHWTVGAMNALDKETRIDGQVANPDDMYSILAVKPEFGRWSCQTATLHRSNSGSDYANTLLYFRPQWVASDHFTFRGFYIHTRDKLDTLATKNGDFIGGSMGVHYGGLDTSFYTQRVTSGYFPGMGDGSSQGQTGYTQGGGNISYTRAIQHSWIYLVTESANFNQTHENSDMATIRDDSANIYFDFRFRPRFTLTTYQGTSRERVGGELLRNTWSNLNLSWYQYHWAELSITGGGGQQIFRSLGGVYPNRELDVSWSGTAGAYISYILRDSHFWWKDMPQIAGLDNEFDVTNLDLEITFTNRIKLVCGVRYNNYEGYYSQEHLGSFTTLRWDYNPTTRFFLGYRDSSQVADGTRSTLAESAWFKVIHEF